MDVQKEIEKAKEKLISPGDKIEFKDKQGFKVIVEKL